MNVHFIGYLWNELCILYPQVLSYNYKLYQNHLRKNAKSDCSISIEILLSIHEYVAENISLLHKNI